ncbi:MAG: cytochrome c3 family protein, partial [Ignavibacteriales bacterium]|nr:cytochrome c3 family protein [Ignavibacteriales bacterium]
MKEETPEKLNFYVIAKRFLLKQSRGCIHLWDCFVASSRLLAMTCYSFSPFYIILSTVALVIFIAAGCQREDTSSRQPIAFSHARHAGDFKIGCQYCHSGVRRGANAYIPSVQTCMGCHKLVAATKPEIVKVRQAWETQQPIQWTKVNQIADFVYFNHYPHIAKGIDCKNCHGD